MPNHQSLGQTEPVGSGSTQHRGGARPGLSMIGDLAVFVTAAIVFLLGSWHIGGDAEIRFNLLSEWLTTGRLPAGKYSLIGPSTAAGFRFLDPNRFDWWCSRVNLMHLTLGLLILVTRPELGSGAVRTRFIALVMVASMFPRHVQEFYGEVFTSVWVAVGLCFVAANRPLLGWFLTIPAVANTPATLPALALVAIERTWSTGRLRHLLAPALALGLIVAENTVRRGSPFASGYEGDKGFPTILPYSGRPGFSYPLLLGLIGLLFSSGKGLVFFAPGLTLWLTGARGLTSASASIGRGCEPHEAESEITTGPGERGGGAGPIAASNRDLVDPLRLWLIFLVGMLAVYASWWAWYGGWYWGPRLLLFASIPSSLILARLTAGLAPREDDRPSLGWRWGAWGAVALSAWVGASGYVYHQRGLDFLLADGFALESFTWFAPEFSPLWYPLGARPDAMALANHPMFGRAAAGIAEVRLTAADRYHLAWFAAWSALLLVPGLIRLTRESFGRLGSAIGRWRPRW